MKYNDSKNEANYYLNKHRLDKLNKYYYNINNYKDNDDRFEVTFARRRDWKKIDKKIFNKILNGGLLNRVHKCEPDKKYQNQFVNIFIVNYLTKDYYIKIIFTDDKSIKVLSAHTTTKKSKL